MPTTNDDETVLIEASASLKLEEILGGENIAELLSESELASIGEEACRGYEADLASRAEWDKRTDAYIKLALQIPEAKSFPWQGASNVKFPLLTISAIQFAARAYPAFIRGNSVARCMVVGEDPNGEKAARSRRVTQHMNFQLMYEMEDWEPDTDRLLHTVPILGCAFKKTYFNSALDRNVSELVLPKDLVVDYYTKTLEDAYRVTQNVWLRPNEYIEGVRLGQYLDLGELGSPSPPDHQTNSSAYKDTTSSGSPSVEDDGTPHLFLEQHTYLDLDGDGYAEPYVILIHKETRKPVAINRRFREDSIIFADKEQIAKISADQFYTKYGFIPSPDGSFYDLGFGTLLSPINESVNTIINQLIDAGTLNNLGGGFIGRGVRARGGNYRFKPGEWKFIDVSGDDLRRNIVPMPTNEPSRTLFTLLGTLISSGEKLASITDPITGESPGTHIPAASTMALIEQGLKVFSGVVKRLHRSLHSELRKIYRLNGLYLSEEKYFNIIDSSGTPAPSASANPIDTIPPQQMQAQSLGVVKKDDYNGSDMNIVPFSDPSIINEGQTVQKLQALFPFLQDPEFQGRKIKEAFVNALGIPNSDEFLAPIGQKQQPDPALLIKIAEMETEKERVAIKRFEAEARAIKLRAEALQVAAAMEVEIPDGEYEQAVAKYTQIQREVKNTSGEHRADANHKGAGGDAQGMEGQPGDGALPVGGPPPQGGA